MLPTPAALLVSFAALAGASDARGRPLPPQSEASPDSALASGAEYGEVAVVRQALEEGAHADGVPGAKYPPLMAAALGGHAGVVEALIGAGARLTAADGTGYTAIDAAAWKGSPACVQLLLEADAELLFHRGADGNNLLHRVCLGGDTLGHAQVVELLLDRGLSAERSTGGAEEPLTPLLLAASTGNGRMVEMLCAHNSSDTALVDTAGAWILRAWERCQRVASAQDYATYELTADVVRAVADCDVSRELLVEVALSAGLAVDGRVLTALSNDKTTQQQQRRPLGQDIMLHGLRSSTAFSSAPSVPEPADGEDEEEDESCREPQAAPHMIIEWSFRQRSDWILYSEHEAAALERCYLAYRQELDEEGEEAEQQQVQVPTLVEERSRRFCNITLGADANARASPGDSISADAAPAVTVHDLLQNIRFAADTPLRQTGIRRDARPDWATPLAINATV
jgi:ankyrin repeat protein